MRLRALWRSLATPRFPVGERVFAHHHAPCLTCEWCLSGMHVHCDQWKRTKLEPGGMAEYFAVAKENLNDTLAVGEMRAVDAALIEPLACVVKSHAHGGQGLSLRVGSRDWAWGYGIDACPADADCTGFELNAERADWARQLGIGVAGTDESRRFGRIFICPGSQSAFDFALGIAEPGASLIMFAPLPPNEHLAVPQEAYFRDMRIANSYSCGPQRYSRSQGYPCRRKGSRRTGGQRFRRNRRVAQSVWKNEEWGNPQGHGPFQLRIATGHFAVFFSRSKNRKREDSSYP